MVQLNFGCCLLLYNKSREASSSLENQRCENSREQWWNISDKMSSQLLYVSKSCSDLNDVLTKLKWIILLNTVLTLIPVCNHYSNMLWMQVKIYVKYFWQSNLSGWCIDISRMGYMSESLAVSEIYILRRVSLNVNITAFLLPWSLALFLCLLTYTHPFFLSLYCFFSFLSCLVPCLSHKFCSGKCCTFPFIPL